MTEREELTEADEPLTLEQALADFRHLSESKITEGRRIAITEEERVVTRDELALVVAHVNALEDWRRRAVMLLRILRAVDDGECCLMHVQREELTALLPGASADG